MSPAEESGVTGEVPGSASVEERLETVRTSLGHRLVDGNAPLDELLGSPLLERLPAADRAYWRGLAALTAADREQGRCLLEQAAIEGNHPRAVLALAVDLLRSGERGAIPLLERLPAGFDDGTTALLSAAARSLEGDYATAATQLESLTSVDGRARLAVANLYLHQAGEAEMAGHSDRARVFREQAAGALEAAEESGLPFPADFALLKSCLDFVAAPQEAAEVLAEADSPAQTLEPSARTGLWAGNGDALAAAEAAVDLLERSGPPPPEAAVALAQAVARIDSAADGADAAAVAARTSDLLERLLRIHDDDGVRSCCRIVATRAARLDSGRRSPDPAHPTGALLAARRLLGSGDRDAAIATLRSSAGDEEVAARCCSRVADLLSGDVPDESRPEVAGPSTEPGLLLLDAASAFAAGEADAGYRALSSAVRSDSAAAERVIALDHWVAPLLAQAARTGGSPPAALVRSIRQAALGASGSDALTLARCSAAAGESDLALELWQAALADVADPAAPERQELAAFLCHVAVNAHRQGDHPTAATVLRRAARVAAGDGDDETAGTRTRRREGAAR